MIPRTVRRLLSITALAIGAASCGGGGDADGCGGIVEPVRVLTPSPTTLTLDVGASGQVGAVLSGGCATDDQTVRWATSDARVATVSAGGVVSALTGGVITITGTAFDNRTRATIIVTVRERVATTIDARPEVDTLSPLGTRTLTVTVRDQTGALMPSAPVVWRTLNAALATVSPAGLVTAAANGTALIEASTPRGAAADSLRDTVRILIVNACNLVRPVQIGTTVNGRFDASSCQNLFNFRAVNQYSVTATEQTYYSIRLNSGFPSSLIPLNLSSGFYGLATADTAITSLVVVRPGTFGFMVAAQNTDPRTFSVTTALNPDPRTTCAPTDVTTGVNFTTALTPNCTSRLVQILPALSPGQQVRITASAPGFPVIIELRNYDTRALIRRATAPTSGGTATIAFTNGQAFQFGVLTVSGGSTNVNDLVTIAIAP